MTTRSEATQAERPLDRNVMRLAALFVQVRNGKLWRGYSGAIYSCLVSTEKGYAFDTRFEALENAHMFRELCRDIQRKRTGCGQEPTR